MKEQFTKIFYPNNPRAVANYTEFNFKEGTFKVDENVSQLAIHFSRDGNLVRSDSAEFRQLADLKEMLDQNAAERAASEKVKVKIEDASRAGKGSEDKPLRSQFNFADRGCQSEIPILKHRGISTIPPPTTRFADTVTQWMIYDRYMADIKADNDDAKEHGTHTRRRRDDDDDSGSSLNVLALAAASGAAEVSALLRDKEKRRGDELMYSPELRDVTKIMFRLLSQNSEADVYHDFKYYNDPADKYRDQRSGQLLPLWRFHCEKVKRKHVTAIKWNPLHEDMFAVGYGSYIFGKQAPSGAICVYSLKNSRFPEFVFTLESGVCSLDWHPVYPWLLVCGLYDGSVAVYDVRVQQSKFKVNQVTDATNPDAADSSGTAANSTLLTGALANPPAKTAIKRNAPLFISQVRDRKHTDPVWDVKWNPDCTAGSAGFNFFSISSDGRVASWSRLNDRLEAEDICSLKLISGVKQAAAAEAAAIASSNNEFGASPAATSVAVAALEEEEEEKSGGLSALAGGLCFALHPVDTSVFLVGTEEGCIHKCSRAYSGEYLFTYVGHSMAIYSVEWNRYHKNIFLSCSADWTVRMWDDRKSAALLTFDLEQPVGDIAWAPYSATTFAAVTASNDPVVRVYDLRVDKHSQICEQKVIKKGPLTRVAFSESSNVLLVGDQRGGVSCLKLSPNLRSEITVEPKDGDKKKRKLEINLTPDELKIQKLEYVLDDLNEKPIPFDEEPEEEEEEEGEDEEEATN